jgi:antitoxin ParD1/3/4
MMGTMNISLPDDMKAFVDRQVAERGYGTSSEFVRDLIRKEQELQEVRALILEGMASPKAREADADYFQQYRERAAKARAAGADSAKATRKRK